MKKLFLALILSLFFFSPEARSQCGASLNGYLSYMNQSMFEDIQGNWVNDNLVHNRLNFKSYLGPRLNFALELRNRFMFGETIKTIPSYADSFEKDKGWADLSWNIASDSSYVLNSTIDRVYLDLTLGKLQMTIGRQRINWGMNFVWNPNDIFNNYSFFDFDYVERPGSDAVRLQYYMGSATSLELAGKINNEEKYSIASLIRFNLSGFDFQLLAGVLDEEEYVFGTGLSGYFGPVSVNAELSFLDPIKENDPREQAVIGGLGLSYNTPIDLFIQFEYLYNQAAITSDISNFSDFYYRNITLRDLSFTPHTFFANASYPISPLVNTGISTMMFPKFKGFFIGPSLDLSIRGNLDMSFIVQHFQGELGNQTSQKVTLGFLRIKWSF